MESPPTRHLDPWAQVVFEGGVEFLSPSRPTITFGRGSNCEVRFGHEPRVDQIVSRSAGRISLGDLSRVVVENLSEQIAFDLKEPAGPLETIRPGASLSPAATKFEIHYAGSIETYLLRVESFLEPQVVEKGLGDTTTRLAPLLTARQWATLDAYAAPMRGGSTVPATHAQVADELGWSVSLVRLESNAIWSEFLRGGIPMRDFPDKRDTIVDAVVRHKLTPESFR